MFTKKVLLWQLNGGSSYKKSRARASFFKRAGSLKVDLCEPARIKNDVFARENRPYTHSIQLAPKTRARASWPLTLTPVIFREKNFPRPLACTIRSGMHLSPFWKLLSEIRRQDREISSFLWNYFRKIILAFSPRFAPVFCYKYCSSSTEATCVFTSQIICFAHFWDFPCTHLWRAVNRQPGFRAGGMYRRTIQFVSQISQPRIRKSICEKTKSPNELTHE